jgi:hypothetical protein
MRRLGELVAPTGAVVTTVPNLAGLNGLLQRLVDADCLARHVVFDPASLDRAHATGGLVPMVPARYLGVVDPGAVNFARVAERLPALGLKLVWAGLTRLRRAGERLAAAVDVPHGGRWLAPSLLGVYRVDG